MGCLEGELVRAVTAAGGPLMWTGGDAGVDGTSAEPYADGRLEASRLAGLLSDLSRQGLHELYGMRLCLAWLDARVARDPEAKDAISLLRRGEAELRRLFAEATGPGRR